MTESVDSSASGAEVSDTSAADDSAPQEQAAKDPTPPPTTPKKYKLKVYDQEEEVDEDEVVRRAQKASAADRKFQEAAALEKRYNAAIEKLRTDPKHLFESKEQAEKWAEDLLIERLKYESMSDEQRRAFMLEQRAKSLEDELNQHKLTEKEKEEKLAEERHNALRSQAAETLDVSITKAIQDAGIKKVTPSIVRRVAMKMLAYHKANDGKDLDAATAVKLALDDRVPEVNEFLEGLDPNEFETKLPATFLDAVRKHYLNKATNPIAYNQRQEKGSDDARPARRKAVAMSTDDYFKNLESRFK